MQFILKAGQTMLLVLALSFGGMLSAGAQESEGTITDEETEPGTTISEEDIYQEYVAWAEKFEAGLDKKSGEIVLKSGSITLNVPDNFYFLNQEDSSSVLEDAWGNPPDDTVMGMLFPVGVSPLDEGAWGVTIEWRQDGYVSDKDAAEIDYDDLLSQLQQNTQEGNEYRQELGFASIELVGWAEEPVYDAQEHRMFWAKDLIFGESDYHTLNYDMRILGRRGVLTL